MLDQENVTNIDESLEEFDNSIYDILTTDWFSGDIEPTRFGLYQWTRPCQNFWQFPKRPDGYLLWTVQGWLNEDGTKTSFNPEEDMWRGAVKPQIK